ncbi:hypothetical protein DOY81_014642, partial [Sarcophaga bullata]
ARKKDREETIQKLSEKSSLIDNMRAQIVKLEKQQMNLPSPSNPQQPAAPINTVQLCPICNKAFKSLSILQSHVNDCIDKN